MIKQSYAADIGRLLGWAARPKENPARHDDYHRVITRYREDPDFAQAAESVFIGAGLYLTVDERAGAIVAAAPDSPLRVTMSDVTKRVTPARRSVVGLVILAIAAAAFPEPSMLDDPDRLAMVTARSLVDLIDRAAESYAQNVDGDGSVDEELVEAWRFWNQLNPGRPQTQRQSMSDRHGVVSRVCKLLVEAGYLTRRSDIEGGTWVTRPRFRHAVAELAEDSEMYLIVNGLVDAQNGEQE